MKRIFILLISILLSLPGRSDEGMWLLPKIKNLNMPEMKSMGLTLSASDIYSVNESSLKDAVVIFGGFCTGEIISPKGLLLTNHHCGFDFIQQISTVEKDYLKTGYWAASEEDEIPCEGLTATFLVSMKEITEDVLKNTDTIRDEGKRNAVIEANKEELIQEATQDTHLIGRIKSFFEGNQYFLMIYEEYTDVRLVGTPPKSIGKFGGDTDNWMWPRHTGDFALFRIYTAPDRKPADYSEDNIPLNPKHYFPLSLKGIKDNAFSMILGYPGRTDRYWTSYQIMEQLNIDHPARIKIRGERQKILKKMMALNDTVRIKYASKYSHSSNYWKYSIGQSKALKKLSIAEEKRETEKAYRNWVSKNKEREEKYGEALSLIRKSIEYRKNYKKPYRYIDEAIFKSAELIDFSTSAQNLYEQLEKKDISDEEINSLTNEIKKQAKDFYKNYDLKTDQKVITKMLEIYYKNIDQSFHPEFFNRIKKKYDLHFDEYVKDMFDASYFTSQKELFDFLEKPKSRKLRKDPAFVAGKQFYDIYIDLFEKMDSMNTPRQKGERLYMKGLMEMNEDKTYYPNANFTMRMTYGTINGYHPRDAVYYDYKTHLKGVMEKKDPTQEEFHVPQKLIDLYKEKDYSPYGEEKLVVNFINNNDITGGNSGSPVINQDGNLIGLAFDGNWESMSGDINYEKELQKCIAVDIRYILFIIDKFANASYIMDELELIE